MTAKDSAAMSALTEKLRAANEAAALRRATTTKGCGCEVDAATGETVKPCQNGDKPAMVGRKLCGCVVAAFVVPDTESSPQEHGDFANEMRRWARQGLERETKTVAFVRHGGLASCPHVKRRKSRAALALSGSKP